MPEKRAYPESLHVVFCRSKSLFLTFCVLGSCALRGSRWTPKCLILSYLACHHLFVCAAVFCTRTCHPNPAPRPRPGVSSQDRRTDSLALAFAKSLLWILCRTRWVKVTGLDVQKTTVCHVQDWMSAMSRIGCPENNIVQCIQYTTSLDIKNHAVKGYSHSFRITCTVSEQRIVWYKISQW